MWARSQWDLESGDHDSRLLGFVNRWHRLHKMSGGIASNIVVVVAHAIFACAAVEIGCRQSDNAGERALTIRAKKVVERSSNPTIPPPSFDKFAVTVNRRIPSFNRSFFASLRALSLPMNGRAGILRKPGRIKNHEIVGVDGRLIAACQRVLP